MAAEALRSEFLCSFTGFVAPPRDIGATPRGTRRYYPVIRGSFEGPRLRGEVLPDGGDWLLMRPDGVLEQDVRITLKTDDGRIHLRSIRRNAAWTSGSYGAVGAGRDGRSERILLPRRPGVRDRSRALRLAEQDPSCGRGREAPPNIVRYSVFEIL
jgi:hypothetical protein